MGLWPFGRTKADVETTSRVVVLRARDAVALRAKVTVKFEEPQTQAIADQVLETCQDLVRAVVREAPSGAAVLGFDAAIAAEVQGRLPSEPAVVRSIEIAGMHIVGDPGHVAQPAAGPEPSPAWLHTAAPASSDRAGERVNDRPTPVHAFPATKPVGLERSIEPPAPTPPSPVARTLANDGAKPPAHDPAKRVHANDATRPHEPTAKPHDAPPPKARDPFASTAQSPQPVFKAAKQPDAPPAHEAKSPPANARPAAETKPAEDTQRGAKDGDAKHAHFAHAPTMPAIAAQSAPPSAPIASRVVLAAEDAPAAPAASPGAPATAQAPAERPRNTSPGAYSAIGRAPSTSPPPPNKGPGYPHFAASNALRQPPGPRRTSSSGQLAAVSPDSLSGPPSAGRVSRTPDEPSASSRSYAHLAQSSGPRSGPSRSSTRPPPAAVAARRRVVASRLLLPMGAGPYEVARGLTPLFRDTAGRILVAFLRTYDLTVIRRVPFDAVESDILSSLTAPSDGAPGTYTASHATEIQRWREAFGAAKLDRLQREANLAAAALAHEMFTAEAVPSSMTAAVVEGLAGSAFGDPDMLLEIGRYLYPARETTSAETLANMIEVAGEEMPPGLEAALDPLFASLREEVAAVAELAKEVMLTPA